MLVNRLAIEFIDLIQADERCCEEKQSFNQIYWPIISEGLHSNDHDILYFGTMIKIKLTN